MGARATDTFGGSRAKRAARKTTVAVVGLVAGLVAVAAAAAPALANAPTPDASSTHLVGTPVQSQGGITVTIAGTWTWATQNDCPAARNGVGYQVAWFDGNTANPIGDSKSPDGVLFIGGPIWPGGPSDNIVHSIETLGGSATTNQAWWDGVPTSYITHASAGNSTPNSTDAANWFSHCGDNSATISSGQWGPISHTYPAGTRSITVCPIMYDPHGGFNDSGKSSAGDLTAGGHGHNGDNSYEGNGQDNACLKSNITLPSSSPASSVTTPAPGFTIVKEQRIGSGTFTTGTLTGTVGQIVRYEIIVTNTGNTSLTFSHFSDPHCDGGTISGGPSGAVPPGGQAVYTCHHRLNATDQKNGSRTNTAVVTANSITHRSNKVVVKVPRAVKAKKISRKPKRATGFTG